MIGTGKVSRTICCVEHGAQQGQSQACRFEAREQEKTNRLDARYHSRQEKRPRETAPTGV